MSLKNQKRIAFGYNRNPINKIEINEGQAAAVKLMFELYADGESMGSISARLETCNIPTPYNNPKWGRQAISNILSYERYLGDEDYPRIIEKELFDQVQMIKQSRAK